MPHEILTKNAILMYRAAVGFAFEVPMHALVSVATSRLFSPSVTDLTS
jgi:hypothetical protein